MSMISSVSSGEIPPMDYQSSKSTAKSDFKALATALQSENLADAQKAYAALQKDRPAKPTSRANPNSSATDPMAALGKALQSGDLAAAQTALNPIKAHHGHHHGGAAATGTATMPAETSSVTSPTASSSTVNDPDHDGDNHPVGQNVNIKL